MGKDILCTMLKYFIFITSVLTQDIPAKCSYNAARDEFPGGSFPKGFKWSLATASYQIEGSWDVDGKGEQIWDKFSHRKPCSIDNCQNGDIACDSYKHTERDIEQLVKVGVKNYRFSISWARLLPNGTRTDGNEVNTAGIQHYSAFIDKLVSAGITPFVTLYHWDLPQALQDKYGGWVDDQILVDYADYARLCFEQFGDRVKYWITINEPSVVADLGYGMGWFAPGVNGKGYIVRHNTVRAHAQANNVYVKEFKDKQQGKIGITMATNHYEPRHDSAEDQQAAQQAFDYQLGFWADPIYLTGDYPASVKKNAGDQLPKFTEEEKKLNKFSADFFGLNHYTTTIMEHCDSGDGCNDGTRGLSCPNWPTSGSSWLLSVPWGFRNLLNYIHKRYDTQRFPIIITENGISSRNGTDLEPELDDQWRIDHYHKYIGQMLRAIKEDGANVAGYTAWSLMDNFEWARGYAERFGLIWTNFTNIHLPDPLPDKNIFWKDSAKFYSGVVTSNSVEPSQ